MYIKCSFVEYSVCRLRRGIVVFVHVMHDEGGGVSECVCE